MSFEKPYQPTPEEIKKGEESMTEDQKMKSAIREEAFDAGRKSIEEKATSEVVQKVEIPVYTSSESRQPFIKIWEAGTDAVEKFFIDQVENAQREEKRREKGDYSDDWPEKGLYSKFSVRIRVRRSSGKMEDDWSLNNVISENGVVEAIVVGKAGNKRVSIAELVEWNS